MNTFSHVPPGFRFHPTDEELVDYYLRKKVSSKRIDLDVIKDVDLYKIEPWDLQEMCRIGREEENEWYLFSHKDKKYPTGTRTNRATGAGFWKATGRDKGIYSKKHELIGMRKTLVFYKGRAPNGQKSDWIMHEYRLERDENATPQEEGWVVCRVFKKRVTTTWMRKVMVSEHESQSQSESPPCWYDDQVPLMPAELDDYYSCSPPNHDHESNLLSVYPCKKELDHQMPPSLHLPLLETPKQQLLLQSANDIIMAPPYGMIHHHHHHLNHATSLLPCSSPLLIQEDHHFHQAMYGGGAGNNNNSQLVGVSVHHHHQVTTTTTTDWRVLDKFVASQLSQDDEINTAKDDDINSYSSSNNIFKQHIMLLPADQNDDNNNNNASTSNSTTCCPIDLWK